jgi:hypothetical protein
MTELYSSVAQVEVEAALGKVVSLARYGDLLRDTAGWTRSGGKVVENPIRISWADGQNADSPPFTANSSPVMIDEVSLQARINTARAISSGAARRPRGTIALKLRRTSGTISGGKPCLLYTGVSVGPGLIALTRTLRPTSSAAQARGIGHTVA